MEPETEPNETLASGGPVFREESYYFRFTELIPPVAERLRRKLAAYELESRRPDVIGFLLREDLDYTPLVEFVREEQLSPGTFSLWASVVTSSGHGGMRLPRYVLQLAQDTCAEIDLSFVACTDG